MTTPVFRHYEPGDAGRLCSLQASHYAREWAFTKDYEAVVARDMGLFLLRYDPARDLFLTIVVGDTVEGGVILDGGENPDDPARLRWFILSPELKGKGLGHALINRAMSFAVEKQYHHIYLTTFEGLDAARHLYEHAGFHLTQETMGNTWGVPVTEQRFDFGR